MTIDRNRRQHKNPLVSIVTPCYNGASHLVKYFEGLLSQTYKNIELIFVNDGSTDKTSEIARNSGVMVIDLPINTGIGSAVKAGNNECSDSLLQTYNRQKRKLP